MPSHLRNESGGFAFAKQTEFCYTMDHGSISNPTIE
jgi:hypothetical protein